MDRLIVKNFGPLKDIDIELKEINLFIGENGSGKSVLGKTITIILNVIENYTDIKNIKSKFEDFNIDFIDDKSKIIYSSQQQVIFKLEKSNFILPNNEIKSIAHKHKELKDLTISLKNILDKNNVDDSTIDNLEISEILHEIENTEKDISKISSKYIPAERNLISIFNQSLSSFITAEIPLPKFLLHFSSDYVKARDAIKTLDFLNIKYEFKKGKEYIFHKKNDSILLEHSSSGIQSTLPLYLTVKYFTSIHRDIIIEEPELNLFPKAQYETIKYIIGEVSNNNELSMMTHSPYVLSTLNNLLFAYKISVLNKEAKIKISELLEEKYWINPENFSAYYLEDGKARNIVSKRGLISDNEIDEISEDIAGEFDEMLEIYRKFKDEK